MGKSSGGGVEQAAGETEKVIEGDWLWQGAGHVAVGIVRTMQDRFDRAGLRVMTHQIADRSEMIGQRPVDLTGAPRAAGDAGMDSSAKS